MVRRLLLLCGFSVVMLNAYPQCNVVDTLNSFYKFRLPGTLSEFDGYLCSNTDSVGSTGAYGYYDGDGFSIRLISGTQVTFSVDSCSGNPVSLTVVDSSNTIIPGAWSPSACTNTLDFTAPYTGLFSVVMNVNGVCGGGGTSLIGQVYVKIKQGTTVPSCPGVINDTICGAIRLYIDSAFVTGNSSDAYASDPMDPYLDSIGADSCSPPNNTMWYYLQSPVNADTVNIWVTSGAGSGFHSWLVGFVASNPNDFCNSPLNLLGCVSGAADDQGIDTVSIPLYGVQAGQVYIFMIDGFNGGAGPFSIALRSDPYVTGINETDGKSYSVFPNPADEKIFINSIRPGGRTEVQLFTRDGKIIYSENTCNRERRSIRRISPRVFITCG